MSDEAAAMDAFGRLWFSVPRSEEKPISMGMVFNAPTRDGQAWIELGTITAGVVDGDRIHFAVSLNGDARISERKDIW